MNPRAARSFLVTSAIAAVVLTGCIFKPVTDPTRYFVLSPVTASEPSSAIASNTISLGIAAVAIPDYLNNPLIAVRRNNNEMQYSGYHRWSERLDKGIQQVLAANLSQRLRTDRVRLTSWARDTVTVELHVTVIRFDLTEDGGAVLEARWQIKRPGEAQPAQTGHRSITKPAPPLSQDASGAVAALSAALAELSDDIARAARSAASR